MKPANSDMEIGFKKMSSKNLYAAKTVKWKRYFLKGTRKNTARKTIFIKIFISKRPASSIKKSLRPGPRPSPLLADFSDKNASSFYVLP